MTRSCRICVFLFFCSSLSAIWDSELFTNSLVQINRYIVQLAGDWTDWIRLRFSKTFYFWWVCWRFLIVSLHTSVHSIILFLIFSVMYSEMDGNNFWSQLSIQDLLHHIRFGLVICLYLIGGLCEDQRTNKCLKEIGLGYQIFHTIPYSILSTIGRAYVFI